MRIITCGVVIVCLLAVLSACQSETSGTQIDNEVSIDDQVLLGYCPTMRDYAKQITQDNENVSLRLFSSTQEAFGALRIGRVEVVLVGRIGTSDEVQGAFEQRLRGGLTLVGRQKAFIPEKDLTSYIIHTAEDEELVKKYIPRADNIIYYTHVDEAIQHSGNDIVLMSWDDFSDDLELVIPIDEQSRKVELFRIPVLYSYHEEYLQLLNVNT